MSQRPPTALSRPTGAPSASRTRSIGEAIAAELARRKAMLDADDQLGSVTVSVKLQTGTTTVRWVSWQDERVVHQR